MGDEKDVPICATCGEGRLHRGRLELRGLNAMPKIVCWLDPEDYWVMPRCVVIGYWKQSDIAPYEWYLIRCDLRPSIAKLHSEDDLNSLAKFGQDWLDVSRAPTGPSGCTGTGGGAREGTGMTEEEAAKSLRQTVPEDTAHLPSFGSQIGPLELRHLSEPQPEIVFWTPTKAPGAALFCHVLAHWRRYLNRPGGSGVEWDLSFCGERPFAPEVNRRDFIRLAEAGQNWLKENRPEA
jgi:hypothetical protein